MQNNPTRDELLRLIADSVADAAFRRATFAGATRGAATEWVRVVVRPIDLRGDRHFQFAYQGAKKAVTKNFLADELELALDELSRAGSPASTSPPAARRSTSAPAARAASTSAATR